MRRSPTDDDTPGVLVWDLPLRLFHWLLTVAVAASFVTHWLGSRAFTAHVVSGSVILVLVAFRIAWGFVGTRYARFSSFLRGPRAVFGYLRAGKLGRAAVAGHNPLGGWMILLLLAALLVQALAGLFASDRLLDAGPLYGWVPPAASKLLTRWHRRVAVVLEIAVPLHVVAVLYLSARGQHLLRPMLTGRKPGLHADAGIVTEKRARAFWIALLAALALGALIMSAPEAQLALD